MSNDSAVIGISYVESIPRELIDPFLNQIADDQIEIIEEPRHDAMLFASVEWFIPTAVFLYSKGYFDGFLQAAGADHYEALKKAIPAWFSRLSLIRVTCLASANKKLRSDNPFTGAMSLMAQGDESGSFKLMFRLEADEAEIAQSVEAFLEFLRHFHNGSPPSQFFANYEATETIERLRLVYFDIEEKKLRLLDPKQPHPVS
jgi:hypothetical protein